MLLADKDGTLRTPLWMSAVALKDRDGKVIWEAPED